MSDGRTGFQLRSLIKKSGEVEISLAEGTTPEPGADEVVVVSRRARSIRQTWDC
jgi:hypothetical protein